MTYSLMIEKPCPVSTANRFKVLEENHEENLDANLRVSISDPTLMEVYRHGATRTPTTRSKATGWQQAATRRKKTYRVLNMLTKEGSTANEDCGGSLNALGKQTPGACLVEAVVDSGAVNSVAPLNVFPGELKASEMSKNGKKYRGPDGSRIPNLGQKDVEFVSDEGHKCGLTWQIADVERPLIAVLHLPEAGNEVVLKKHGGEVINEKSGKRIKLQRKGGVYIMRMWVPQKKDTADNSGDNITKSGASGFPRPGRS